MKPMCEGLTMLQTFILQVITQAGKETRDSFLSQLVAHNIFKLDTADEV